MAIENQEIMKYSQHEPLLYPEYGRNVQRLVNYALTVEDKEKRQRTVVAIIKLMNQILPVTRNFDEQQDRLWNHIFHISDYKLEVDAPEGIEIIPIQDHPKPSKLAYPKGGSKFRHYGKGVQLLVNKAIETEDEEKRNEFIKIIGNYMKTAYRTWNSEHFVSDEMIIADLETLSEGKLSLEEDAKFTSPVPDKSSKTKRTGSSRKSGYRKKNGNMGSRNGNGGNRRKRRY